jgi:hypothetical protein
LLLITICKAELKNSALQIAIRKFQKNKVLKFNGAYQLLTYADDVNSLGKKIPENIEILFKS